MSPMNRLFDPQVPILQMDEPRESRWKPARLPKGFFWDRYQKWMRTWPSGIIIHSFHLLFKLIICLPQILGIHLLNCLPQYSEHVQFVYKTQLVLLREQSSYGYAVIVPISTLNRYFLGSSLPSCLYF